MRIEVIDKADKFVELRNEWNSLLFKSNSSSIFLSWEWLFFWWMHFKSNRELLILLIKEEASEEIVGIAPFSVHKTYFGKCIPTRKIEFLGSGQVASDFMDFIAVRGKEKIVVKAVFDFLNGYSKKWDVIELCGIDNDSLTLPVLKEVFYKCFGILEKHLQKCPFIKLSNSFESAFKSHSNKMSKNLRWAEKQCESKLQLTNTVNNFKNNDINESLDELFSLHSNRFNYLKTSSSFEGKEIKTFHSDIAANFLKNDWLRFYSLMDKERMVACLYVFKYKKIHFYYQSGFDPEFRKWSPGAILISTAIKNAIREEAEEFNFLRGDEEYKSKWTKDYKIIKDLIVTNNSFTGKLILCQLKIKEVLKKIFKKSTA